MNTRSEVRARGEVHEPPRLVQRVPEPPGEGEGEDTRAWKLVGRGSGVPGKKPSSSFVVAFDVEQSDWIDEECRRTGLTPYDLIRSLVDEARKRGSAA